MLRPLALFAVSLAFASLAQAQQPAADALTFAPAAPATNAAPLANSPDQPQNNEAMLIHQAIQLMQQKQLDAALEKLNAAILADPQNMDGYGLRGGIYASKKQWDPAEKDYQHILSVDANNGQAKFNLSEIQFLQKKYDKARPGFLALEQDKNLQDLASYKVFLCDLFSGRDDVAAKELEAMDQAGTGASFYFGKAAWALYHKQTADARSWLTSAANIYSESKFKIYSASLFDLGYLPLPPPQKS
jgi:Tfp pilus assembly protein PilF